VVRAILAGDQTTGVTLMRMDRGLDTGPVLATDETPIRSDETTGTLTARLASRAAGLLGGHLAAVVAGELEGQAQDDDRATAARLVRVEEAFVDPGRHSAGAVDRAVRAFDPRPGAWSTVEGRRLKLWRVIPSDVSGPEPGVMAVEGGRVLLGARDGVLEVLEVQPEGKGRMAAADWMRGRRGAPARLEPPTPRSPR
jgi:methionyl-tRNA formyltransferase